MLHRWSMYPGERRDKKELLAVPSCKPLKTTTVI